jgi:serine/threonine protein phosphatase 1
MKKTIIIGDIHGCYDELMALLEKIGVTDADVIISLGDIVDRGNHSKKVYEFFKNRPNAIVLMGNHERKHLSGVLNYAQEIVKVQFGDHYNDFLNWLKTLDYSYETEEAIIVHAAFESDKPLNAQRQDVLSGSTAGERYLEQKYPTNNYWTDVYTNKKPIIYGHHVVGDVPKIYNNTFGIDTGACHGGYLTAIELPDFKVHQVQSKMDYWKSEQLKWQLPVLKAKNWEMMDCVTIQRQLDKLQHINDINVINYLNELKNWLLAQDELLKSIQSKLETFTCDLQNRYGKNFNKEAGSYAFKGLIFKTASGNLTISDLKKSLDTPYKRNQLFQVLNDFYNEL